MASTDRFTIPSFFTFFMKYLDPLTAIYGVWLNFFDQNAAVTSMAPKSTYDPDQIFLFHQAGGLALAVAILAAALPRLPNTTATLKVIQIFQFALFVSDIAGVSGVVCALSRQGRLSPAAWTADDMGCGGTYVVLTLVRAALLIATFNADSNQASKKRQ